MECVKLLESLDVLGYAGICVGTERCQILQNSLLILQRENHFRKCYYWGRIDGIENDYHIAYGFQKDCMQGQIYYYRDCLNWLLLPSVNKCGRLLTPLAINIFQGDPSVVSNVYDGNPVVFLPDEDTERKEHTVVKNERQGQRLGFTANANACTTGAQGAQETRAKELKEEDRLAATVETIKEDAVIVPRGGWCKTPTGQIIENCAFQGLNHVEASRLSSYLHARSPRNKWNSNLLTRPDYNYALDFLDTIDLDVPQGCWSLQFQLGERLVLLYSLHWPGMTFYHRLNTPHYGFLYVGNGKKNVNVPFMI